jgi:bifunctional enzyme CysN/CysC
MQNSDNLVLQKTDITKENRSGQKKQNTKTLWFTGLSGSGKSTLANELEKRLVLMGKHTMLLDGDNIRLGLNKDLGFTEGDRVENIRRVAEVSKLMNDAGLIVLTAFISPYEKDRKKAKDIIGEDFLEIYVSTPIEVCEKRDVKGLYKKARLGLIANFTGISSEYEIPIHPDIVINTADNTVEESVNYLLDKISTLV